MWREKVPRDDQETLKEIQSRKTRKKRTGSTKVTNKTYKGEEGQKFMPCFINLQQQGLRQDT